VSNPIKISELVAKNIEEVLNKYGESFSEKTYNEENYVHDLLMDVFNITPDLKQENKQYWGRELGMCWQLIITKIAELTCEDFRPTSKEDDEERQDLFIGNDAIDTKYRIGSGDSGTLKKFVKYGKSITNEGLNPVLLILREDNLDAAITACKRGGWDIKIGNDCLIYIKNKTNFDIKNYLKSNKGKFRINRSK